MNSAAGQYIAARILYTELYMFTSSEKLSYLRTGAYFWSVAIPFWVLWKAGRKVMAAETDRKSL